MPPALAATRRQVLAQIAVALAGAVSARAAPPDAPQGGTPAPLPPKVSPLNQAAALQLRTLPGIAVFGARGATPGITELVDYNAPDWRRSALDMRELLGGDAKLAYAVIQTPRFDVRSLEAARICLAVLDGDPTRFEALYLALAEGSGPIDGPQVLTTAVQLGLDRLALFNASIRPEIAQTLSQGAAFASAAGVLSTPAYVIGGKVIEGYLDLARKRALLAEARGG